MDIKNITPDRYHFTNTVHWGGQGHVYVCHDTVLDRYVAIKEANIAVDQDVLRQEIAALSAVVSKHVVELYDVVLSDNDTVAAIILEYVSGNDLTTFSKDTPSIRDCIKVMYQVASAIADMHGCNLVHRDIKHNNIKRDNEGVVKVFDFGLAKEHAPNATTTEGHGTDGYRAPELYAFPAAFGPAVDTYAFGALCWWMLDGSFPKALMTVPPQAKKLVPSIASASPDLPDEIASTIDSTLSVAPDERPAMADVRGVLERHLLSGHHRAHLSAGPTKYDLREVGKSVSVNIEGVGGLTIRYDGLRFYVTDAKGDVFVNNGVVSIGMELPGASVITIGGAERGAGRTFVTFDVSHPEVVL